METVMKLPIQDRRYYIYKHNMEAQEYERKHSGGGGKERTYEGELLNKFARNQTEYDKNHERS